MPQVDPFINRGIPKDFFQEVQEGRVPGHRTRRKFGKIFDVETELSTINCGMLSIVPKVTIPGPFFFNSNSGLDTLGGG